MKQGNWRGSNEWGRRLPKATFFLGQTTPVPAARWWDSVKTQPLWPGQFWQHRLVAPWWSGQSSVGSASLGFLLLPNPIPAPFLPQCWTLISISDPKLSPHHLWRTQPCDKGKPLKDFKQRIQMDDWVFLSLQLLYREGIVGVRVQTEAQGREPGGLV